MTEGCSCPGTLKWRVRGGIDREKVLLFRPGTGDWEVTD